MAALQVTMLNRLIELCTSDTGLFWIIVGSDLAIALSYFAIPVTMAVVLRHRKQDIPYPWLWSLFVVFIVACGMTHAVHVLSAFNGNQTVGLFATIEVITAIASVATAIALAFVLPQIKLLPSPRVQRDQLQRLVGERTAEKDKLIREINHRIGNQLQVLSSAVSIELRKCESEETTEVLGRLRDQLYGMAREHVARSNEDYLGTSESVAADAPAEPAGGVGAR
jgi:hypothetical protein